MGGWKRDLLSPPFPASKRMFCILFLHSPEVNGPLLFSDTKTSTDAVIAKAVILPPLIQFFLPFLPLSPAQQPVWRNSLPREHKNVPREASYPSLTGHEEAVREPQAGAPRERCGMRAPESGAPATTQSLWHPGLPQQPAQAVTRSAHKARRGFFGGEKSQLLRLSLSPQERRCSIFSGFGYQRCAARLRFQPNQKGMMLRWWL